jgi:hypothetical protein
VLIVTSQRTGGFLNPDVASEVARLSCSCCNPPASSPAHGDPSGSPFCGICAHEIHNPLPAPQAVPRKRLAHSISHSSAPIANASRRSARKRSPLKGRGSGAPSGPRRDGFVWAGDLLDLWAGVGTSPTSACCSRSRRMIAEAFIQSASWALKSEGRECRNCPDANHSRVIDATS